MGSLHEGIPAVEPERAAGQVDAPRGAERPVGPAGAQLQNATRHAGCSRVQVRAVQHQRPGPRLRHSTRTGDHRIKAHSLREDVGPSERQRCAHPHAQGAGHVQ